MLPIHEIQNEILARLAQSNRLVLTAPTGSGKTTQVPQFLFSSSHITGQIIVLQPRRLATRMVAQRVANEMKQPLGSLVGYQTRHDSRISAQTRIRFMTEGLFLRMIQHNPKLPGIGAVVLDEFHERSLAADTSLALVKQLQETQRADLRLVVMSATLDAQKVATFLNCTALQAGGRTFPVNMNYLENPSKIAIWEQAADALDHVLGCADQGDVLIFMPGLYEIRRTIEACQRVQGANKLSILPLHGELSPTEQDAALCPREQRRVIVSTNVAQTSITIEGITHVIDSGLARVNRFDPRRGINVLLVEPISLAAADQRAGRAGRTAPGNCFRLWTAAQHRARDAHDTPEIQRMDLAEVMLGLAAMGVKNLAEFPWLEPPETLALNQAVQVLKMLHALEDDGSLTRVGQTMAQLPMHPRLSRLLVEAAKRGVLDRATLWAGLLSERDILFREHKQQIARDVQPQATRDAGGAEIEHQIQSDLVLLEESFERAAQAKFDIGRCASMGIAGQVCRELQKTRQLYTECCEDAELKNTRKSLDESAQLEELIKALLVAYPDHVAMRRGSGNRACALVGQRRGELDASSIAQYVGPLLALDIREVGAGNAVKTTLSLVSELRPTWLLEIHPDRARLIEQTLWQTEKRMVERVRRLTYDDLIIEEKPLHDARLEAEEAASLIAEEIIAKRLKLTQWDEAVEQWIARCRCVAQWFPEKQIITYSDEDLRIILQEICSGAVRFSQVEDRPCLPAVRDALSWNDQQFVERMAPDRIALPRGWKMKVEYQPGSPPRGRAKIQDFYDLHQTPMIADGRVAVLLEILGPNFRPLQMTQDLAGFWKNLYPTLRKELSRKYPRHEWR